MPFDELKSKMASTEVLAHYNSGSRVPVLGSQGSGSQAVSSQSVIRAALKSSRDSANERIGAYACLVAWNRFGHRTDELLPRLPVFEISQQL